MTNYKEKDMGMVKRKTLICKLCNQEWGNSSAECKKSRNGFHRYQEKLVPQGNGEIARLFVCRKCGEQTGESGAGCAASHDEVHSYAYIEVRKKPDDMGTTACKYCGEDEQYAPKHCCATENGLHYFIEVDAV